VPGEEQDLMEKFEDGKNRLDNLCNEIKIVFCRLPCREEICGNVKFNKTGNCREPLRRGEEEELGGHVESIPFQACISAKA
jgi:hypothetical protein